MTEVEKAAPTVLKLGKGTRVVPIEKAVTADHNAFTARYTQVESALKTLTAETFETEAFGECVMQHKLPADVFGVLVMQHLPFTDANMTVADKTFWLAVADEMGPDWVESFRRTAAFMAKVGGF